MTSRVTPVAAAVPDDHQQGGADSRVRSPCCITTSLGRLTMKILLAAEKDK
jgi:hypothetical protein